MTLRSVFFLCLGLLLTLPARAEFEFDLGLGPAQSSDSDYRTGLYGHTSAGYRLGEWAGRLGVLNLGEFELGDDDTNAGIRLYGPYLLGARRFDLGALDVELGLGLARVTAEAKLFGRLVDKRHDWEPFLELGAMRDLTDWLALRASTVYFHDQVGSDVAGVSVGVRFSF